jgi:hypothetical protein
MKRLSTISLVFFTCIVMIGCGSTSSPNNPVIYSHYEQCAQVDYNPLQIFQSNDDHSVNKGSVFYLKNKAGKHIFITSAHILKENLNRYQQTAKIRDKHGHIVTADVISIREKRIFKKTNVKNEFSSKDMIDIAILEVLKLPENFAITPLTLPKTVDVDFALSQGIDASKNHWQGCFGIVYHGDNSYLYNENLRAIESMSGTPVFNENKEILGIITASGHIIRENKNIYLYVILKKNGEAVITTHRSPDSKILFAILTPATELKKFLHETYGDNF